MQRNVWNDIVSWQTRRLSNSAKYLLHASMTTTSKKKKKWNLLENWQKYSQICSVMFVLGMNWKTWYFMVSAQTCTVDYAWRGRGRRRCPHTRWLRSSAGFPWSSCWAPAAARRWDGRRRRGRQTGGRLEVESGVGRVREQQPLACMAWRGGERCKTQLEPWMWVWWSRTVKLCVQAQCMLWWATRSSKCGVSTSSLVFTLLCFLSRLLLYASFQFAVIL